MGQMEQTSRPDDCDGEVFDWNDCIADLSYSHSPPSHLVPDWNEHCAEPNWTDPGADDERPDDDLFWDSRSEASDDFPQDVPDSTACPLTWCPHRGVGVVGSVCDVFEIVDDHVETFPGEYIEVDAFDRAGGLKFASLNRKG